MKKFILKLAAVAALIIASIILAVIELKTKGTITGLTLVPFAIWLVWFFSKMVASDLKEFAFIYEAAEDE